MSKLLMTFSIVFICAVTSLVLILSLFGMRQLLIRGLIVTKPMRQHENGSKVSVQLSPPKSWVTRPLLVVQEALLQRRKVPASTF